MSTRIVGIASLIIFAVLTSAAAKSPTPNAGPQADVAAVSAAMTKSWQTNGVVKNPFRIDGVHVVGDYALVAWEGQESSGSSVLKRVSGENWKRLTFGGGAIGEAYLTTFVKSKVTAHQLCSGWPKLFAPCQG